MGDLKAHGSVAEHVMRLIAAAGPKDARGRPRLNPMYFELGNWLTDVSQFRDPPAHVGGKLVIWQKGLTQHGPWILRNIASLDQYADELLGRPNQHGALACFLRYIAYYIGSKKFRKPNPLVPPKEFDWVFEKIEKDKYYQGYTQYWPHEHFDFPLYDFGDAIGAMQRADHSLVEVHTCDASKKAQAKAWTGGSSKETCWIELKVLDDLTGNPIEGVEILVTMPDDTVRSFTTDGDGIIDIANLVHGNCELSCDVVDATLNASLSFVGLEEAGGALAAARPGSWMPPSTSRILKILPRTVCAGQPIESLATIADEYDYHGRKMTWKDLAYFNFGTSNPAEINRQLKAKVGCTQFTADRANYRFSSADRPGVIFVPQAWTVKAAVDHKHVIRVRHLDFPAPGSAREDPPATALAGVPISAKPTAAAPPASPRTTSSPPPKKRKVPKCIEDYIEFCAELLTVVENELRRFAVKPDTPDNTRELNKTLALFGHVCHIIEDFYFHSNFIERAWAGLKMPLPGGGNADRENRIYQRRLRSPKGRNKDAELSTTESEESDFVFGGSFGAKDINFTIRGGIEAMAEKEDLPLEFRVLLDPLLRRQLRREPSNNDLDNAKAQELDPEKMTIWLKQVHDRGKERSASPSTGDLAEEALRKAFEIELRICDKFTWVPEDSRGVLATLMQMINQADVEVAKSERKAAELDKSLNLGVAVYPTDNGAAAEVIGSHALMNKDNVHKAPLFPQAFAVATCVSTYIAWVMLRQVNQQVVAAARFHRDAEKDSPHGAVNTIKALNYVDWLHLLRHFICHPDECEHHWNIPAMDDFNAARHHVLKYIDAATVKKRMELSKQTELQGFYSDIARQAEGEWGKARSA